MKLIHVSFAIRTTLESEAKGCMLVITCQPNSSGLYLSKVLDESLTEIFTTTEQDYKDCEINTLKFISNLGVITSASEFSLDDETKSLIQKIKNLNNKDESSSRM